MFDLISKKKEYFILISIIVVFLMVRLPAIHRPYHQDEYKWPMYAYNIGYKPGDVPHPPLSEFIYDMTGKLFNENNFRLTPLIFSFCNLALLYFFVRRRYGIYPALWAAGLFTFSFYSVLASLTVDTDGAVLPFFFLASLIMYDQAHRCSGGRRWWYAGGMVICMILGLLVKISSILGIAAIVIDFVLGERKKFSKKQIMYLVASIILFVGLFLILLLVSKYIFTGFNLEKGFLYWDTFVRGFGSRNFLQTGIQLIKSVLYLSPLFICAVILSFFSYRKDVRIMHIFISIGLIFYVVLFDFSIGALDRYLAFMIVPLSVITGVFISDKIKSHNNIKLSYLCIGSVILLAISGLQFLNQNVPPLYPKTEWIERIISLHWNFLYPFSGGSGPLGFYISWMFIGLMWIGGVGLFIWYILSKNERPTILALLLLVGLVYNGTFIQEYLFGTLNGSAPKLVYRATNYIKNNPIITRVLVYNDNGGWDIRRVGVYERRMYAVPEFEESYKIFLGGYTGYVLYINIPRVMKGSLYDQYMSTCMPVYSDNDKAISATIYNCQQYKP